MALINKRIEIVTSSIKQLSSMSMVSAGAAKRSLSKYYKNVIISLVDNEKHLEDLVSRNPDLVFLSMQRVPREPTPSNCQKFVWISEVLDEHDILYTGSNSNAQILDADKSKAKKVVQKAGLPTAKFFSAYVGQYTSGSLLPIPYPLFIKPPNRGGGLGIDDESIVNDFKSYKNKLKSLENDYDSEALVEEFLSGREFTVAVLRDLKTGTYNAVSAELIAPENSEGARILSGRVKVRSEEKHVEINDKALTDLLEVLGLDIFDVIGARDYGRIDIRMNSNGELNFLESNLIPSLLEGYGNFQKLCQSQLGIDYDEMLLHIVQLGLERNTAKYETFSEPLELANV
jgi:D-alanine-D-alanine ligase